MLNIDTFYLQPNSSIDVFICDSNGITYNDKLTNIVWDIDGVYYYDTLITIYSNNTQLYKNMAADTMRIKASWLDENGNPYNDSCVIILDVQMSISELSLLSDLCTVYDIQGRLVCEGAYKLFNGLYIYRFKVGNKYYTKKIFKKLPKR